MKLTVKIDNVYPDGTVTRVMMVDVPAPEVVDRGDHESEWAEDHLLPLTGTGRTEGDAGYFVEITECREVPELVGRNYEWGI